MSNYDKNTHMNTACQKIKELILLEHPEKDVAVRYVKMGTEEYATFSDFDKENSHLLLGEEYIIITVDGRDLYFVCVTFDSTLTAVWEAMRVVSVKF